MFTPLGRADNDKAISILCDRVLVKLHELVMASKEDDAVAMAVDLCKVISPRMHAILIKHPRMGFDLCFDSLRNGSITMLLDNSDNDLVRLGRIKDSQFAELLPSLEEIRGSVSYRTVEGKTITPTLPLQPGMSILLE